VPSFADCRGSVARSLGLLAAILGRWDEAAAHFEGALIQNQRLGLRVWLAQTQYDYAVMLLTQAASEAGARHVVPPRERADRLLAEALATAEEMGLVRLLDTGTAFALTHYPPERERGRAPLSPPSILRPREQEVLALLAAGATSQELAGELTLALRTVHRHLANIYAKIGARGRVEATAYAFSHGIARPPEP